MNDNEIYERIKKEAEGIEVPESLSPESMRGKLQERPVIFSEKKKKGVWKYLIPITAAAAAFAVVMVAVGPQLYGNSGSKTADRNTNMISSGTTASAEKTFVRSDAGEAYRVAKNDAEVQAYFKKVNENSRRNLNGMETIAIAETADTAGPIAAGANSPSASSHSDTNLMEEGIDEADIVKCDDTHIYRVSGDKVHIINVENAEMTELSAIEPRDDNNDIYISELYLTGDKLIILGNSYERAELTEADDQAATLYGSSYYWNRKEKTVAFFYDIKDKSAPRFLSKFEQDGYYISSRLAEGRLIIFSNDMPLLKYNMPYILDDSIDKNYAEATNFEYPMAGDEVLTPGDIYIPKETGSNSFIMSSVSVEDPGKKIDSCMIMSAGREPYVTNDSIYLWDTEWLYDTGKTVTNIARFTYEGGYFNAVSSCSLDGSIMDEFAIHEENKNLFVLTSGLATGVSGSNANTLTIFDSGLNEMSRISGIAENEMVYAARYIDNIIYFITYRNMDPLFAVDVSDPKNPVMLGSLEITGFSDYLHPWGNGRLLGIGYESDPETGMTLGTKLLMFDITDPAKPSIIGEKVIMDSFPNDLSHKAIFIDKDENLFGFSNFYSYRENNGGFYSTNENGPGFVAYTWNEATKSFEKKTELKNISDDYSGQIRGLRIKDIIYATFDGGIADSKGRVLKF